MPGQWSIYCYDPNEDLFLAGPRREIPSGQARPILLRSGTQSEQRTRFIFPALGFSHMIKSDRLWRLFRLFCVVVVFDIAFCLCSCFFVCLFVCLCMVFLILCPCKFVGQRRTGVGQEKLWSTEYSAVGGDPWFYWEVYVFSGGLSQELCHGTEPIILWD